MKLSKISHTECVCGYTGEVALFASDNFQADCPGGCGRKVHAHDKKKTIDDANRRYSGSQGVSFTQGFHPAEVALARKNMPDVAHCIKDDGRVVYPDSRTEQKFRKSLSEAKQRLGVGHDAVGSQKW
jgi:hypothetical protein